MRPTADNGYGKFEDVRGESGTRVTIRLNQQAISAGLLDEDKLRPVFTKILETSQYSVAFSSDEDAHDIIDASKREEDAAAVAPDDGDEVDLLETASELTRGVDTEWAQ